MTSWSKETFAKNLSYYVERSGRTQKEIAEEVGVSAPTVNDWIKGKKFPRIDKIDALADYFGILKSDLIEDKTADKTAKDNDAIASIIVRLRMDEDFLNLVYSLYQLDSEKIKGIKQLLTAFDK